jgi:Uma2 family endonuclease
LPSLIGGARINTVDCMETLTIELPSQAEQTRFNLRRWDTLQTDPALAKIEGRIETDRHGQIIMSPPPAPSHGSYQVWISHLLVKLMAGGRVLTECPISTADGVRAADIAWASSGKMRELGSRSCFPKAPEICVEVLSPGNTKAEMADKTALYFDAGAMEVWWCEMNGSMKFLSRDVPAPWHKSKLCPKFPKRVRLPKIKATLCYYAGRGYEVATLL